VTRAQLSDVGTILAHARLSATAETGHFSSIDPVADVVTRLSRVSLNNPPIKGHPCSVRFFFFFFFGIRTATRLLDNLLPMVLHSRARYRLEFILTLLQVFHSNICRILV
jgi:hypothetical protein